MKELYSCDLIPEHYDYTKKNADRIMVVPKTIPEMQKALILMETLQNAVPEKEAEFPATKDHFAVLGKYPHLSLFKFENKYIHIYRQVRGGHFIHYASDEREFGQQLAIVSGQVEGSRRHAGQYKGHVQIKPVGGG